MGDSKNARAPRPGSRRMPEDSAFYDKLVPILLAVLGICTFLVIVVALAVPCGREIAWLRSQRQPSVDLRRAVLVHVGVNPPTIP